MACSSWRALLNVPRRVRWSVKIEKESVVFWVQRRGCENGTVAPFHICDRAGDGRLAASLS
jgi:hypothetical protein